MTPLQHYKHYKGQWATASKVSVNSKEELALSYTPGVAEPCKEIAQDENLSYEYTNRGNVVAVISNGTAVLGLGDIGPLAAMPVMEGKAILFKRFANIDAVPIVLNERDPQKLIQIITALAPSFGGINLEDIKAPECFIIEEALQSLGIPVVHDDQHGTAIVVLAGLLNALKVVGKEQTPIKMVIVGAGAAGLAITELMLAASEHGLLAIDDIVVCDSKGIISNDRTDLNDEKKIFAQKTNKHNVTGDKSLAFANADVVLGVSKPGGFTVDDIKIMNKDNVVFAMANPTPEVMPADAAAAGSRVVATGRSDFPNQVNNALAFPGIFRGLLDARKTTLSIKAQLAASQAIANLVPTPTDQQILPDIFDERVVKAVAEAVASV